MCRHGFQSPVLSMAEGDCDGWQSIGDLADELVGRQSFAPAPAGRAPRAVSRPCELKLVGTGVVRDTASPRSELRQAPTKSNKEPDPEARPSLGRETPKEGSSTANDAGNRATKEAGADATDLRDAGNW